MRWFGVVCAMVVTLATATGAAASGSYVLTATTSQGPSYSPTFTGNGFLGVRVPATGQGYAVEPSRLSRSWRGSTPSRRTPRRFRRRSAAGQHSHLVDLRSATVARRSPQPHGRAAGGSRLTLTPG